MKTLLGIYLLCVFFPLLEAKDYVNVESFVSKGTMMFSDASRGFHKAKDPAVVRFNGRYFLYYTVKQNKQITGLRIGVATSDDLVVWKKWGELKVEHDYEKRGFG